MAQGKDKEKKNKAEAETTEGVAKQPDPTAEGEAYDHLAAFDCVRTIFCAAVILLHCWFYPHGFNTPGLADDPEWKDFYKKPYFFPICLSGMNAVPIFMMIAGFFSTMKMLKTLRSGKPLDRVSLVLSRYRRLAPLLVAPLCLGLVLGDPTLLQYSILRDKLLGYVLTLGPFMTQEASVNWLTDMSTTPCWSIVTDFHCNVILICVVPFCYTRVGMRVWPIVAFMVLSHAYRAYTLLSFDLECSLMMKSLSKVHPCDIFVTTNNDLRTAFEQTFHGISLADRPSTGLCEMSVANHTAFFLFTLYTPWTNRISSFFVGAIMAYNYLDSLHSDRSTNPPKNSVFARAMGYAGYFLSCMLLATLLLPVDVENIPPQEAQIFLDVFNWTLLSSAVSFITYCAIVPPAHPFHAPLTKKVMCLPIWRLPGRLSSWMYALHWPILFVIMRRVKLPVTTFHAFVYFGWTTAITFVLAAVVAPVFEPSRRVKWKAN